MSIKSRIKRAEAYFQAPAEQEPLFKKHRISSKRCIIEQGKRLNVYVAQMLIYEAIKMRDPDYIEITLESILSEDTEQMQKAHDRYKKAMSQKEQKPYRTAKPIPPVKSNFTSDAENDFMELCFKESCKGWSNIRDSEQAQICYDNHRKNLPYFDYEKMTLKEFLDA